MSEAEKIKPGHRRCPECKGVFSGPRRLECPLCGKALRTKTAKAKTKAVKKPSLEFIPDPFKSDEIINPDCALGNQRTQVMMSARMKKSVPIVKDFLKNIENPEFSPVENFVAIT